MEELSADDRRRLTLAEAVPDLSELLAFVRQERRFSLKMLWPDCRQTTIRMMLGSALETRVFGKAQPRLKALADRVLVNVQGEKRLDLTRDVVTGYDELWGCGSMGWRTLIVVLPATDNVLHPIIRTCYGPEFDQDWRAANGRRAVEYALAVAHSDATVALCLEGIERMEVVARPDVLARLFAFASTHCKMSRPERY